MIGFVSESDLSDIEPPKKRSKKSVVESDDEDEFIVECVLNQLVDRVPKIYDMMQSILVELVQNGESFDIILLPQ